jgi:hypothetical protein
MATLSLSQIVSGTARDRITLFGLATNGEVYEYSAAREGWVPLPMIALPAAPPKTAE